MKIECTPEELLELIKKPQVNETFVSTVGAPEATDLEKACEELREIILQGAKDVVASTTNLADKLFLIDTATLRKELAEREINGKAAGGEE